MAYKLNIASECLGKNLAHFIEIIEAPLFDYGIIYTLLSILFAYCLSCCAIGCVYLRREITKKSLDQIECLASQLVVFYQINWQCARLKREREKKRECGWQRTRHTQSSKVHQSLLNTFECCPLNRITFNHTSPKLVSVYW